MKKIEDYLHLYLGCYCQSPAGKGILTNVGTNNDCTVRVGYDFYFTLSKVKPILRPLIDMTEEEATEGGLVMFEFNAIKDGTTSYSFTPSRFQWLLSKHFDLFNLIEEGLTIDATKINK